MPGVPTRVSDMSQTVLQDAQRYQWGGFASKDAFAQRDRLKSLVEEFLHFLRRPSPLGADGQHNGALERVIDGKGTEALLGTPFE